MDKGGYKKESNYLFWKDEILQVLYWLQGEGLDEKVGPQQLESLLNTKIAAIQRHLDQLVKDTYLKKEENEGKITYSLSPQGKKEGGQYFAEAFEGMQKAGHGECGPDCEYCYGPDGSKLDNCVHNCASQH